MKQSILIGLIILCSLISGWIWAYGMLYFLWDDINKNENILSDVQKTVTEVKEKQNQPEESELEWLQENITNIAKDISPSVVSIVIKKDLVIYRSDPFGFFQQPVWSVERKVWWGTGFFVKSDGTLITNKHVVKDTESVYTVITSDNTEYDATVIALDPINDIAVMKIESEKKFTSLDITQDNKNTKLGQFVLAVGNALSEFQNSVSLGIISGKDRTIETVDGKLWWLLQTDAAINPGNSGGPLVNLEWEVIGINTAIANGSEWIWFSIALTQEKIDYMLESITNDWRIKRPFIGIAYVPISKWIQQELSLNTDYGAYIINEPGSIVEWSSADLAGIEPGDTILEIDSERIDANNDLNTLIQNKIPWQEVNLKVMKGSWEEQDIQLKLWEY